MSSEATLTGQAPHISSDEADEYALGLADPELVTRIERHTAGCAACREILRDATELTAELALGAPSHPAPPLLKQRVLRAAGIEHPPLIRRAVAHWRSAAGVAAAVVALAALGGVLALWAEVAGLKSDNHALRAEVAQSAAASSNARGLLLALVSPNSRTAPLEPTNAGSPDGRLIWNDQQHLCWILFDRLPQLPAGQVYELWALSNGHAWSLGSFRPDASGMVQFAAKVSEDIGNYESAAITVGAAPGSDSFSGHPLFSANLSDAAPGYQ